MFDHFRALFVWTFQMHVLILYLLPFTIRLRYLIDQNIPLMMIFSLEMIQSFSFGYSVHYSARLNRIPRMVMRHSISIIYPSGVISFDVSEKEVFRRKTRLEFFRIADVRHSLIIICMTLVAILMAPITWYLWIYTGSANANFYFAMTMVFNVAQVRRTAMRKFSIG